MSISELQMGLIGAGGVVVVGPAGKFDEVNRDEAGGGRSVGQDGVSPRRR